jgi:predicted nucleic acid-binding protein
MGKTTKTALVVLDNTVLTNFGLLRRTDLVTELWPGWACSTPEVLAEYSAGIQAVGLPPDAWRDLPVMSLRSSENALALRLAHRLGAGERSCLAVAINRGALLATDDRVARQYAQKARLEVTGSLGILVQNVKTGRLSLVQAQSLLDTLRAAGYRSPSQSLDEFFDDRK